MDYYFGDSPEIKDCPLTDQYGFSTWDPMDSLVSQIGLQCLWDGLYIAPTDKTPEFPSKVALYEMLPLLLGRQGTTQPRCLSKQRLSKL